MKLVLEESNPPAEANQLVQSFTDSSKDQKILEKTQKLVDKFHGQYYQYKLALDESIKRLDDYGYGGDENLQPIEIPEFPDPINSQFLSEFETAVKKEAKTKTKQFHVVDDSTCLICRQEMEENEFLGYCDGCFQRYHKECGRVFAQRKLECLAPNCAKKLEGSIFQ
uniref:Uncharacterized protein n=1 Tax=Caenorhabditis japonica TaxID=281687 RepID=A0A8R1ENU4_CAEJA